MKRTGLIVALALTAPGVALGTTLNVPAEFDSIQTAIDSSTDGDTILVQPGVYTEIVNYSGKNVVVGSLFLTTGDTAYIESTIIDGNANGRSVVVFRNGEDSSAVLTGLTIRNGDTDYGGGIYIRESSPTISHVVVTDCHASRVGGGIYCALRAAPVISRAVITANTAGIGGGGFGCYNLCEPVLINCTVSGNTTTYGGGLYTGMNNQVLLQDTDISDNHADGNGGGIYSTGSALLTILNCQITGNESGSDGGGIYSTSGGDISVVYTLVTDNHSEGAGGAVNFTIAQSSFTNVTFANNSANSGSGIYIANDVSLDLRNCIIWNVDDWAIFGVGNPQEVTVNYCDVQNGQDGIDIDDNSVLNWGDGNIPDDPRFFDADSGDYRLSPGSPCINAGDPDSPLDPDSSRADMGALPFYHHPNMLFGYVTVALNGEPVVNATLITSFGYSTVTDSAGFYRFSSLPVGVEFSLQVAAARGYIGAVREVLFLDADDTLQVDFSLHRPIFAPSQWALEATLPTDSAVTLPLSIRNDGDYNLRWNAKRAVRGVDAEPWGQIASLDISSVLDVNRVNSVVLVEDRYYIAYHSDSNAVAVLDRDLRSVGQFGQYGDGLYGYQDMDWDGELLWGSGESDVYGFTPEGDLVKQWGTAFRNANAIAWDSDRQVLWTGSLTGQWIVGYDRDGNSVTSLDQQGMLVYGLAYWADDPDGYPLYILHTPDLERNVIMKMNPATGDTMTVMELRPEAGGKLRSAYICDDYIPTVWTFMAMNDNPAAGDRIDVWLLNGEPGWLTMEPVEGEVLPQGGMDLEFSFTAAELDTGLYEADVRFRFPEIGTEAIVGATMRVEAPVGIADCRLKIEDFRLGEAYPNPFNDVAVISYQLSVVSLVELRLYDISGRLVQEIDEGWQEVGEHRAVIDGSGLASGVYFLKLAAGNWIATRKIVCVK